MGQCQQQPQQEEPHNQSAGANEQKGHYDGECDDLGRPHGQGAIFYASDQSTFKGEFRTGKRFKGRLTLKNGDYYEGFFNEESIPHGEGVWVDKANGTFRGIFTNGQFTKGQVDYSDKSKFKGTMLNGRKHGENCELIFGDGDKFTGEFDNEQFKHGTFESKTGLRYQGGFFNGMKEG